MIFELFDFGYVSLVGARQRGVFRLRVCKAEMRAHYSKIHLEQILFHGAALRLKM